MQELSQVKANCAVSGDSSSFDTATSALTRAEELTRKYITNHSNSTSSSSSSPTAVFENTGSDGYWGSPTGEVPGKTQLLDDHSSRPLPVSGNAGKHTRKEKTKTEEKVSPAKTAAVTGGGGWGRCELYFDDTVVYLGPSNNTSTSISSSSSSSSSSNRSREE